jgi:predicted glutamine amidotransferase
VTPENVHSFQHTHNAQIWHFCHNGTIKDPIKRSPEMKGDTDSERYFHLLLNHLDENHLRESIDRALSSLKNYTSLNAFLLNENRFYAINRFSKSLLYYTLHLHQGEEGALLSSEPLLDVALDWNPLTNGTVMIFDRDAGMVRSLASPTG